MLHVAPDLSGVIPLNAFEAQAASVRDLAAGVMDVSGVAGTALKEMQEVRDAGQWAQARDGMYRFEQDVMRELEAGGDSEHLQERWKKALSERLPSYLPARMSGPVRERVAMARENLETAGSIYLQKMSHLGQLEEARRYWAGGVESAVEQGEAALAERRIKEGSGIFVTGEEASRMAEEAHSRAALNRAVEEILYPAMEDYAIDIIIGKGPSANSIRLDLPKFTLIGATTRAGSLSAPLRDRFGVTLRLELYTPEELAKIVTRSAGILNVSIEPEGAMEIARRSRGTPRIANRMLRRVRDFAQVMADGVITKSVADKALLALEVDYLGLDNVDRRMLQAIIENYGGGPVGIETLAATIGEEAVTLLDVYEPYLMQLGFLQRTPRGRCVTCKAYEHLGLSVPKSIEEVPEQLSL